MEEIVWEDPPESPHGGGSGRVWADRLAPLRERPGQWANLGRRQSSTITQIRQGRYAGIAAGDFEAEGREYDKATNLLTVYVRYVGKADLKAVGE